jgi:glycosyltransferase involved in cell wall biosynthesis
MKVLFYTETAFAISETFIFNQIYKTDKFEPVILCEKTQNEGVYDFSKFEVFKINTIPVSFIDRIFSYIKRNIQRTGKYSFPASSRNQIEKIILNESIDIIHCNYGNNALKFLNIAKKFTIPLICHFHGYDASQLLKETEYCKHLRKLFHSISATITVSKDMTARLTNYGLDLTKNVLIPYGTNITLFDNNIAKDETIIRLLHAGRIANKKGVPDLIRVFGNLVISGNLKNIRLDIIGDGDEREISENLVKELNLEKYIVFWGKQPHNQVIDAIKQANIFILNSRVGINGDMEGYPNTIIEAMAAGCAVVSTNHAGIPDAVENDITGLLVDEKDNVALENAIKRLCTDDRLRQNISVAARVKAIDNFGIDKMRKAYLDLYTNLYKS